LDTAAKAWLIGIAPWPRQLNWWQVCAAQNVPLLADKAPPAVAEPLIEALRRSEALSFRALESRSQKPKEWWDEVTDILRLTRSGLSAIEDTLQGAVDLAEGDWVEVVDDGPGRIAQRDGQRLVIDLGRLGVLATKLFETPPPAHLAADRAERSTRGRPPPLALVSLPSASLPGAGPLPLLPSAGDRGRRACYPSLPALRLGPRRRRLRSRAT